MRVTVVVAVVALSALGLGGCRGTDRVAAPTGTAHRSAPDVAGERGDPLADVERGVDAIERDLDSDTGAAAGR